MLGATGAETRFLRMCQRSRVLNLDYGYALVSSLSCGRIDLHAHPCATAYCILDDRVVYSHTCQGTLHADSQDGSVTYLSLSSHIPPYTAKVP